MIDFFIHIAP